MKNTLNHINVFGCNYPANETDEVKDLINSLDELETKTTESVILSYNGLETASFALKHDVCFIASNCFDWLAYSWHESDTRGLRERIMEFTHEDKVWTKKRNAELSDIWYRKIKLTEPAQKALNSQIAKIKAELTAILSEMEKAEEQAEAERNERKALCEVVRVYKDIKPAGGERGVNGYYDADILINSTNEIIRMVCRDVFDVGAYNYPKRLEGTNQTTDRQLWTDGEMKASKWAGEFVSRGDIRM